MSSKRGTVTWRAASLLTLLVLVGACAGGTAAHGPAASPRRADASPARVKELSNCSGERFSVDLLESIRAMPDGTLDAQREQLRDWIWTVTLGRIAQRTSADEVLSSVADQPLVRDDALAHVLHMQVGPTRSTTTKSGSAIVMVEAADAQAMAAEVAEAIDVEALHIGTTPADAQVYQYVFHPELARAEVCAMKGQTRAELESAAQRYRSATITTAAELEGFLSGGVDLLSAECTEAGLEVKGRQRPRNARASLTVEHIAALSQASGHRFIPLERFGFSLDKVGNRAQLDENARQLDALRAPIEIQPPEIQIVLGWKRQNPGVPTQVLLMSLQLQKKALGRPGFSLDPHTSASFAAGLLDDFIAAFPDVEKLAAILRGANAEELATTLLDRARSTNEPFAAEAKAALIAARGKLKKASPEEAEAILHPTLPKSFGNFIAESLLQVVWKYSTQQCSRYDGPLYGTATGMTFFYTDLLAKIWMLDQNGAAPEGPIEGFQSSIHGARSTASCGDTDAHGTRIWFGVREEGFTREPSGAVHFAPIATRMFAKSSNPGARQEEFEPAPESRRFVQWWDDHFPQIAAWEPQYEVLNQLMKWSVVVQNAVVADKYACLAPLDAVEVRSNHRIDRWIAETRDLQWRGPVSLLAPPKGAQQKPGDPECMLLFESERYYACGSDIRTLAGGVAAATPQLLRVKPMRSLGTPAHLARLGREVAPVSAGPGRVRFAALPTSRGALRNVSLESSSQTTKFVAEIEDDVSQIGSALSWDKRAPIKQIDKSVAIQGNRIVGTERKNGLVSAELHSSDLSAADVKVEVKPSTLLQVQSDGQKIAKRAALDGIPPTEAAALELGSTREILDLGDGKIAWQVDAGSAKKWVHMQSGGGIRGPPPGKAAVRFDVGVPDGAPHRPGSPLASREPVLTLSIMEDGAARAALVQKGKRLATSDPTQVAVKEMLGRNDVAGAMKALEQSPSAAARTHLFEHALEKGDDVLAARVVEDAIRKGASPSELRALGERLQSADVAKLRAGGARSSSDGMRMKLAIAERKRQTPSRSEALGGGPAKGDAAVYAPASYPRAAELPPAVHPSTKLLLPDEQYVTRTLDDLSPQTMPDALEVGGVKYEKRVPGREVAIDYGAMGSPLRLLHGARRPIRIITRCSDETPDLPPCHEQPSPEALQMYEEMLKCDLDGDRKFTTSQERGCLDEQRKRREAEMSTAPRNAP